MTVTVQEIFLTDSTSKKVWQNFLVKQGISNFSTAELASINQTVALIDDQGHWLGTGSIAGQTLKYLAVDHTDGDNGGHFNQIVSVLETSLAQAGIFHSFVFTKVAYQSAFEHVGYHLLAKTLFGLILEKGVPGIDQFRASLPAKPDQANQIASIVLNANPFTLGHRYLVEQAAKENDFVYVFVVAEDQSLFTAKERQELVRAGTSDLQNIVVVTGGPYIISSLSFPAYFLDKEDQSVEYQTDLDAHLFKKQIGQPLGITSRYLGTEPASKTTATYNLALQRVLPPEIKVKERQRLKQPSLDNQPISARTVRQAIRDNHLGVVQKLVPVTTFAFIKENLSALQERIRKGQAINGN